MRTGLETAAMDAALYRKLLLMYRKNHPDFAQQFAAASASPDGTAATRLAHSLRGTSGNIGAFGVQEAAAALEALCARGADAAAVAAALAATVRELDVVLPGLNALPEPAAPTAIMAAHPQWAPQLERLRTLLHGYDAEAVALARELAAHPPDAAAAAVLGVVVAALDVFDFDGALQAISRQSST